MPLQEPDAHFPDACKQLVRCHLHAVLYASCCQAIAAYTNEYAWAHIEHNQEHAKNKVDGQTLTVEKYLDLLLSSST